MGRWDLLSRGTLTPPLSQLPLASPLPTVLLPAALSAVRNKALLASRLTLLSDFGREDWDSSSIAGKGFSGPVLACHTSTRAHTRSIINICRSDSWAHGKQVGLRICGLFLKGLRLRFGVFVTTANMALAGEEAC